MRIGERHRAVSFIINAILCPHGSWRLGNFPSPSLIFLAKEV
jgi:hypothetical protein